MDAAEAAYPVHRPVFRQQDYCSSISTLSPSPAWSAPYQSAPSSGADETYNSQAILPPSSTIFEPFSSTRNSPPTAGPQYNTQQTPPNDPSLPRFDTTKCLQQRHCLVCLDPTTTLTCYKRNCQCHRGIPSSHYMPASRESCYDSDLCLSCPSGTTPFTWGMMAVCLTTWRHRPLKGEGNPLTNWTEQGVTFAPVGTAVMGIAPGMARPVPAIVGLVGLGFLVGVYVQLA